MKTDVFEFLKHFNVTVLPNELRTLAIIEFCILTKIKI